MEKNDEMEDDETAEKNNRLRLYGTEKQTNELVSIIKAKYSLDDVNNYASYKSELLPNAILISGEPGTGKTTLLKYINVLFGDKVRVVDLFKELESKIEEEYLGVNQNAYFNEVKYPKSHIDDNKDTIYLLDNFNFVYNYFFDPYTLMPQDKKILDYLQDIIKPESNNLLISTIEDSSKINTLFKNIFDNEIKLPLPNFEARLSILKRYLENVSIKQEDLVKISGIIEGYNGAEIIKLAKITYQKSIKENKYNLTYNDFFAGIENIKPVVKKKNESSWEHLGGMQDIIDRIRKKIIFPIKYHEIYEKENVKPAKGILLYGPPGVGKTTIAKNLANEAGFNFFSFSASDIHTMWHGEDLRKIKEQFKKAKENAPAILFIDEFESLAAKRDNDANSKIFTPIVDEFLRQMDGIEELKGVVVVAATNMKELLDPAIIRDGRFDERIMVPPPNLEGRKEIFSIYLKKLNLDTKIKNREEMLDYLSSKTEGFTGANIEKLCNQVAEELIYKKIARLEREGTLKIGTDKETIETIFERILSKNKEQETERKEIGFIKREYLHDIDEKKKIKV